MVLSERSALLRPPSGPGQGQGQDQGQRQGQSQRLGQGEGEGSGSGSGSHHHTFFRTLSLHLFPVLVVLCFSTPRGLRPLHQRQG
jgi:hypothetical protein